MYDHKKILRETMRIELKRSAGAATRSLGDTEPIADCDKLPLVDGGVTGLKLTRAPRRLDILFQSVPACVFRECRC